MFWAVRTVVDVHKIFCLLLLLLVVVVVFCWCCCFVVVVRVLLISGAMKSMLEPTLTATPVTKTSILNHN